MAGGTGSGHVIRSVALKSVPWRLTGSPSWFVSENVSESMVPPWKAIGTLLSEYSKKKLRFLCLKGRCTEGEDGTPLRLEWWQSAEEFAEYAKTIQTPLGASD